MTRKKPRRAPTRASEPRMQSTPTNAHSTQMLYQAFAALRTPDGCFCLFSTRFSPGWPSGVAVSIAVRDGDCICARTKTCMPRTNMYSSCPDCPTFAHYSPSPSVEVLTSAGPPKSFIPSFLFTSCRAGYAICNISFGLFLF